MNRVFPVSQELSLEEAAFAEPLACCVHSLKRSHISYGSDVVIVGAGIMGQLHAILARLSGTRVIVVEPRQERRELALKLGAHIAIDPTTEDEQAYIKKISGDLGPEAVFITIPSPDIAANYIENIGKMGQVILWFFQPNKDIPMMQIWFITRNGFDWLL